VRLNPKLYILILLLISVDLLSCGNKSKNENAEGVISYQIKYLDSEKENPIIALLPRTMELKFKGLKSANELTGDMGLFAIRFIINGNDSTTTTLIRVLDKKYCFSSKITESIPGYLIGDDMVIRVDSSIVSELAGLNAFNAKASFTNLKNEKENIDLLYTTDIQLPYGNAFSPYKNMPGLLLKFRVNFNGINMEFLAQGIEFKDVEDKEFSIPLDYEVVDRDGIEKVMQKYLPHK
jgi:hypothetical protein